jgi:hypothetical protein
MSALVRLLFALVLTVGLAFAPAAPADQPMGQFQPSAGDRDGDRLADADDCAPDDPSRPAQSGQDADCDGAVDTAFSADSSAPASMASLRAAARRAARMPVVEAPASDLGPAVVFRPRQERPLIVFAGRAAMRVSVRPTLVFADGRRTKLPRSWSAVVRGEAWAFRMRPSDAQRVVLAITVRDGAGTLYKATRALSG